MSVPRPFVEKVKMGNVIVFAQIVMRHQMILLRSLLVVLVSDDDGFGDHVSYTT